MTPSVVTKVYALSLSQCGHPKKHLIHATSAEQRQNSAGMIGNCCWQMRWMELQQCGLDRVKVQQLLGKQQKKAKAGKAPKTSQIPMPQLKPCASSAMRECPTSCATQ